MWFYFMFISFLALGVSFLVKNFAFSVLKLSF